MNTIEKQLLLQDICARLPYDVIVEYGCRHEGKDLGERKSKLTGRMIDSFFGNMTIGMSEVYSLQPYLRPMSDITEDEFKEWHDGIRPMYDGKPYESEGADIDFFNKHHIDYRDLIGKGLALKAPEGMYKTN